MKTTIVRGAVIAMALSGWTVNARAQTRPTSTVEVGPSAVSDASFKAGEYNGLERQGGYGIGNVDWRGGNAGYNSDSALRWRIKGNDLGLHTRSLSGEFAQQGRFRVNLGFDQLRRNRSDTFQTPYEGAGSASILTLPGTWIVPTVAGSSATSTAVNVVSARGLMAPIGGAPYINAATNSPTMGALLTPTSAQRALVDAAAAADLPLFHTVDLFTERTRFDAAFNYRFDQSWLLDASFRPEHKNGFKPMGTVSRSTGSDISTIIPDMIDADHNQVNVGLSFKGAKSFAQAAYYGSYFANHVPSMSWQNWATPAATVNTISSAPGNSFSQFNVTGGVNLSATTKVVANSSYARTTQNDAFITDATTPVVPVTSLNALVLTRAFSAKLTSRPSKKLNLAAGYRYDDRDNRTGVHIFQYADAGEAPAANVNFPAGPNNPLGAMLAQNANANRPYGRTVNQVTADADYGIAKRQWIKLAYEFERIGRACANTWISCADADTTNEHTLRTEWRAGLGQDLSAKIGYAYLARRTPNYNENAFLALVPYANVSPAAAVGGATALSFMTGNGWTGWGPAAGYAPTAGNMNVFFPSNNALANAMYGNLNRISELPGMRRYYVADRNRNKVRSALSWQASDVLSLQAGLDLNRDIYPDSTYGVQNAKSWALDVDGSYTIADDLTASVWYTYENQRSLTAGNSYTANSNAIAATNGQPGVVGLSGNPCDSYSTMQERNNNNKLDPCLNWTSDMLDNVHTVGFGLTKKAGSFDLSGNVIASRARWDNNVAGGSWANNILNGPGGAPTAIAAFFIPTSPVPTITTDTGELRLSGKYTIGALHAVRVSYAYMRMRSSDPAFEGMQVGSVGSLLPTNEQPFNYSVSVVGVSYILSF
jgi:MtrB/PioB family decaheme-associated outer membrane protein